MKTKTSRTTLRRAVTTLVAGAALVVPMAVAIPSATAVADTLYVNSATGSDGPGCGSSSSQPCKTISHVITELAAAGDTIQVAAGPYDENVSIPATLSGLRLEGAQSALSGADASRTGPESVINGTNGPAITVDAANVTVSGFTVIDSSTVYTTTAIGIYVEASGSGSAISNNIVGANVNVTPPDTRYQTSAQGIYLGGGPSSVNVEGNLVSGVTSNDGSANGIAIGGSGAQSSGVQISGNTITGIHSDTRGAYGVEVNSSHGTSGLAISDNTISDLTAPAPAIPADPSASPPVVAFPGGWVHAIGIEAPAPSLGVTGNNISIAAHSSLASVAVWFENEDTATDAAAVNDNAFNNVPSDVGTIVIDPRATGLTVSAAGSPSNTCTGAGCVNQSPLNTTTHAYYPTIQAAVNKASTSSKDTISVGPGTYNENVDIPSTLTEGLTLDGANAGVPGTSSSRGAESIITGPTSGSSLITVEAPHVTIDGFSVTASGSDQTAIIGINMQAAGSYDQIQNNIVSAANSYNGSGANAQGIVLQDGPDNVTVQDNLIENVSSEHSAQGVQIGNGYNAPASSSDNVTLSDNTIKTITAVAGAYGIQLNNGKGAPSTGATGLVISGNIISGVTASGTGWVHAIGIEANAPSLTVTGNTISGLSGGASDIDRVGVWFEGEDTATDQPTVNNNNLAVGSGSYGIAVDSAVTWLTVDASKNWWGSASGPSSTIPNVSMTPWCLKADCSALSSVNTVVVTPSSGWTVSTDATNGGAGQFVSGPGTPPNGVGSFQLTIPTLGKAAVTTDGVAGQLLSAVDAVSYSTYRSSTSTVAVNVDPVLNMEICADGMTGSTCNGYTTLVWEPVYAYGTHANGDNPVQTNAWQTWNALSHDPAASYTGGWWSTHAINGVCATNCFVSLASIQAANPNAVITSFGVDVGHEGAGTFSGNTDGLTLGLAGTTTVYDFEPAAAAPPPAVNKPPTASSQSVTVAQGSSVSVTVSGSDPDGDPLTYTHGGASHGSVSGSGASLTYTPAKGYSGSDAFSFTVSDGKGGSATGVVSVLVTPTVVKPPTAQSISVATVANTSLSLTLSASDPNGQALTYSYGSPVHGFVSGSGASLTYTPNPDYSGSDLFSFTVTNTSGKTATGFVSVTVAAAPLSPPVTQTVVAGGTAAWTPPTTGGAGTPASPPAVVPSVTVPNGGTVTFTPITTPAGIGSGSGSGTGTGSGSGSGSGTGTSAGTYTLLSQSFIISAPAATADAPLALNFAIDTSSLPVGTDASNLTVFRNGVAVPSCTDPAATVAAPDPCVDPVTTASGQASITVLSSHASTWTFGTAVLTAPSKVKVAGIRGVGPGGSEKVAVRVWNDDGSFAASTPVTIAVSGANTANGVVTTNAKGFATFSYTPKKLGVDTVSATAGTVTGTATVHIVRPVQQPRLGAVSRHAGTVNIMVQTSPAVLTRKVKIYAVRKVRGHKATLVFVGSGMTNGKGRAHVVIRLASGQSFVLKARMTGADYTEHLSARATGTVK